MCVLIYVHTCEHIPTYDVLQLKNIADPTFCLMPLEIQGEDPRRGLRDPNSAALQASGMC